MNDENRYAWLFHVNAKKRVGATKLHAGQPVNADGTAGAVAPKLDELLDGEDTSQVLNAPSPLVVASLDIHVGISRDPSDMSNAYHVRVEVSLENSCAAVCGVKE